MIAIGNLYVNTINPKEIRFFPWMKSNVSGSGSSVVQHNSNKMLTAKDALVNPEEIPVRDCYHGLDNRCDHITILITRLVYVF
jgi:hypothetical protein